MSYDFTDNEIVMMVTKNHHPTEIPATVQVPTAGDKVEPILLVTVCIMDHEPWPCSAVRALRQHGGNDPKGRLSASSGREILELRRAQGKIAF